MGFEQITSIILPIGLGVGTAPQWYLRLYQLVEDLGRITTHDILMVHA
jgi:hypothetical protein